MALRTTSSPPLDVLAIGESLRDVFYQIDDATVSCSIQKDRCLLCLEYAEKIPVARVTKIPAAGNASNAAVAAARLRLRTALVSWVGTDTAGKELTTSLQREKVDTRLLTMDPTRPTSEATLLTYQGERTQLLYFQPRNYKLPSLPSTRCIYYSAMGKTFAAFDRMLIRELRNRPSVLFTFQPGTTHIRKGMPAILPLLRRSQIFVLNKEEAEHLLQDGERTICNLLDRFHHAGATLTVITDGPNGAHAFDGTQHWHMPIFPGKATERTGAGDSFASTFTIAHLRGEDLPTALRWGTANSWSVVQQIGPQAGLLTLPTIQKTLRTFASVRPTAHTH